jgi:hypothetical protein
MLFNFSNLIQNYKLNIKGAIQAGMNYGQEIDAFYIKEQLN